MPGAKAGFLLIFSEHPFPGCQFTVERRRSEAGGAWYYSEAFELEGWFCPALFRYFADASERIYAQVKAKAA